MPEEGYQGWSSHQAWELALAIDNEEPIYRQRQAWKANFEKKMKRRVYKRDLAIKGIRDNLIPQAITHLRKQGILEYSTYPKGIKQEVADHIVSQIEEDICYDQGKNYDSRSHRCIARR